MSEWLVLTLAMAAACAVVLTITLLSNRRIPEDDDPSETPDVIEYMTMMIGVIYAIVLGLAIAGVWEGLGAAQESVRTEAQALHEVDARSAVYPPAVHQRIHNDVETYVSYVLDTEWKHMGEHGDLTDRGAQLLNQVRRDVTDYKPANDHEGRPTSHWSTRWPRPTTPAVHGRRARRRRCRGSSGSVSSPVR